MSLSVHVLNFLQLRVKHFENNLHVNNQTYNMINTSQVVIDITQIELLWINIVLLFVVSRQGDAVNKIWECMAGAQQNVTA